MQNASRWRRWPRAWSSGGPRGRKDSCSRPGTSRRWCTISTPNPTAIGTWCGPVRRPSASRRDATASRSTRCRTRPDGWRSRSTSTRSPGCCRCQGHRSNHERHAPPSTRTGPAMGLMTAPARPRGTAVRGGSSDPRDLFNRVFGGITTAVVGVMLGIQYWTPNKRVIPVVAVLLVFGVAWRLSMAAAINVLVFLLPYPKGTVFGNTNLAFILIVFSIWLLRISLRMSPPARSSPLNLPIFGMILWYILSFYNVRDAYALERAAQHFEMFLGCVLMYYMIINSVRTQRDLERLHLAQMLVALGVFVIAAWEARHAGQVLIPGLLDFSSTGGHDFNTRDVRVGASFRDYELLSEYCGIYFLMSIFLWVRAQSATRRTLLLAFGMFNLYTMFTTVTRGVFIALGIVTPYLLFTIRRHLNPVRFMTWAFGVVALVLGMNLVVAKYTNSGDLFRRMVETKVVHGVVPEAREAPWG